MEEQSATRPWVICATTSPGDKSTVRRPHLLSHPRSIQHSLITLRRFVQYLLMSKIFPGHINNLYNTTFWALVQKGGMTTQQAEEELKVRIP